MYATDREGVVAVANGEMSWRTNFEGASWQHSIRTVTNDRVIAADDHDVCALDTESGNEEWVLGDDGPIHTAVCGDTVYAGVDSNRHGHDIGTIRAHDLDDGTVRWRNRLDGGPMESIRAVRRTDGETIFAETALGLYALNGDGDVTGSVSLTSARSRTIRPLDGEHAVVGTDDAVYAAHLD